jgi:hypothetical protein
MKKSEKNQAPIEEPTPIRERCDKIEEKFGYLKELTQEEKLQEEETLVGLAVKISDLENELKSVKTEYKAKLDPLKKDFTTVLSNVRSGKKFVQEEIYIFLERKLKRAEYYNSEGILVYWRPLTIDEVDIIPFQK